MMSTFKSFPVVFVVIGALIGSLLLLPTFADETFEMDPALVSCVEGAIGADRFKEISSGSSEPTTEEKALAEPCFQGYKTPETDGGEQSPSQPPSSPPPSTEMPAGVQNCLKEVFGEDRFNELVNGSKEPTDAEKRLGQSCFSTYGDAPPVVEHRSEIEPGVGQCLKLAVGEQRYQEISAGESPTLKEREAGEKCFGVTPAPIHEGVNTRMPDGLKACLVEAVGQSRFDLISAGEGVPTEQEMQKGEACFAQHGGGERPDDVTYSDVILPPPAEEVPFIPEDPDLVSVDSVEATPTELPEIDPNSNVQGVSTSKAITLSGKAPSGTVVDIYVFSEPIAVSTQADVSGEWSYTLERDLPIGDHVVYAVVRAQGESVRSEETEFTIVNAGEVVQEDTTVPQEEPAKDLGWILYTIYGSLAAGVVYALYLWKKRGVKKEEVLPTAQGEEGQGGS